jgi:hypothetical protein
MGRPPRSGDPDEQTTTLLRLAVELRRTAAGLDRGDIVAKADELIVLIAADRDTGDGKAGAVIRFLDGLGF